MKTPIALLALLLAVKLGAADATPTPSVPVAPSITGNIVLIGDGTRDKPLAIFPPNADGKYDRLITTREPVVTRTADGWEITFKEPAKPALAPSQRLAPDGVNVITKQADGSETTTLIHVVPAPATTASTSRK